MAGAEGASAMKLTIVFPMVVFASMAAAADVRSAQVQIAGAVLAAPEELREGAAVLGYDAQGGRVQIREGKNELICLATDPTKTAFNVACYHKDLEPFMARGRELLAQKVTGAKRNEIRFKEVEDGKLPMPKEPRTLYVLTGASFDAATGKVEDPYLRWVIYVPFATPQSTGLSTKASDSAPWLMSPGTAGGPIMINPPKKESACWRGEFFGGGSAAFRRTHEGKFAMNANFLMETIGGGNARVAPAVANRFFPLCRAGTACLRSEERRVGKECRSRW